MRRALDRFDVGVGGAVADYRRIASTEPARDRTQSGRSGINPRRRSPRSAELALAGAKYRVFLAERSARLTLTRLLAIASRIRRAATSRITSAMVLRRHSG